MNLRLLALLLILPFAIQAQHILYSQPESDDSRRTNFDIIGRVQGNILVFKNNRSSNAISVYDNQMKLIRRVNLDYVPDKYTNIDFVQFPDYCLMLYEYEHKNIVHFAAVKLDGQANKMSDPVDLDTTQVGAFSNSSNKIYTNIISEDKQHLMILKINSRNAKNYVFTSFLFNQALELEDRHRIAMPVDERNNMFSQFALDNDGALVFARFLRGGSGDYVTKVALVTKGPTADTFAIRDIGTGDRILDEIKVKVDNNNHRYLITAFYYKQRRGNIEGLYTVIWDKAGDTRVKESLTIFSDQLRASSKSSESGLKMAFNDYFIKHIITSKDGGYLVISEVEYTTSRGNAFNRWDYMGGGYPYMGPMDYYSPFYNPYSPWNRYGVGGMTRYNSENILILSFDQNSNLQWSNVMSKSQFDDDGNGLISHVMMNTGGALHFLYNQYERRTMLLSDQSISPDGKLTRYPTLRNLDKGYEFMARYGKQISSNQIVIPCLFRNYLCFSKLEF